MDYTTSEIKPKSKQRIAMAKNGKYLKFESAYNSENREKKVKTAGVSTRKHRRTLVLGSYQFNNK